ncbi:MAG: hypothetical protein ACXVNR_07775, partial [Bacteroidia bacterium]
MKTELTTKQNMKNKIGFIALAILVASCGAPDNKAALEKLKKQKSDIEAKIATLEEEIKKTGGDSSATPEKSIEVIAQP